MCSRLCMTAGPIVMYFSTIIQSGSLACILSKPHHTTIPHHSTTPHHTPTTSHPTTPSHYLITSLYHHIIPHHILPFTRQHQTFKLNLQHSFQHHTMLNFIIYYILVIFIHLFSLMCLDMMSKSPTRYMKRRRNGRRRSGQDCTQLL